MRREAYLATLSFITVLLLAELDNAGSDFGLTKPLWIGATSWVVWLISHYSILASLILCIVTSFSALATGTPSRVVPPTVLAGVGALFYLINYALEDVMRWFNFERVTVRVDGADVDVGYGTIPDEYKVAYYVCNAVPFWLFLLAIVPFSLHTHRQHHADKRELAARGVTYNDAEQAAIKVEAQGGAAAPLAVLLRGERHGSSLPGLYAPVPL